jgi:hypothetical protein
MKSTYRYVVVLLYSAVSTMAFAQANDCDVKRDKFVQDGTADAKMAVKNNGSGCLLTFKFEGTFPPDEWKVTSAPKHGKVETGPAGAKYLPESGYSGPDEFTVQMLGRDPLKHKPRNGSYKVAVDVRGP